MEPVSLSVGWWRSQSRFALLAFHGGPGVLCWDYEASHSAKHYQLMAMRSWPGTPRIILNYVESIKQGRCKTPVNPRALPEFQMLRQVTMVTPTTSVSLSFLKHVPGIRLNVL